MSRPLIATMSRVVEGAEWVGADRPSRRRRWAVDPLITAGVVGLLALLLSAPALAQTGQVVEYYHLDALGSVRVVTDQNVQVVSRHDFLPFGEEWSPPANAKEKKLFTGHERDAETGLDYFGARYYRPQVGRFTTIDPLQTTAENLVDPQRWNRYAYVLNNPLKYTDPDGRWPQPVHVAVFRMAFPRLDAPALALMVAGSQWADDERSDPAHSFAHGMRDGTEDQSVADARRLYGQWVNEYLAGAKEYQSFWHFGVAAHGISDTYAPPHGGFQAWNGIFWHPIAAYSHRQRESSLALISEEEAGAMISGLQRDFYLAFGAQRFSAATGFLYSRPIPGVSPMAALVPPV